jgi:serine phosphatase RsbU (regulator of sigma subunit)
MEAMELRPERFTPLPSQNQGLNFLAELCDVVASNLEMRPVLEWMVTRTTRMLGADEGCIRLLAAEEEGMPFRTLVRATTGEIEVGSWSPEVSKLVLTYLVAYRRPLATPDLQTDPRFAALGGLESRIRAVLAVPLLVDGRIIGMLAVTSSATGRSWTGEEAQLLSIVASQSASALEKTRLRAASLEKERMDRELGIAREVQMNMVPSGPINLGLWQVAGRVVPARHVGGDSFDYFNVNGSRFAIASGDVAGKGVPSALLTSTVLAAMRAYCDGQHSVEQVMQRMNGSVARLASYDQFVTMFYAEFDAETGEIEYSNAGHPAPLLRRADGSIEELTEGGVPLGLLGETDYQTGHAKLAPGDSLLVFSDGVTEAFNTARQQFGDDRLRALWQGARPSTPTQAINDLLAALARFRGPAEQNDDITMVVLGPRS